MPKNKADEEAARTWSAPTKRTIGKPWSLSKAELDQVRKMSRADLESAYVGQLEMSKRWMRLVRQVQATIKQASALGL